MAPKNLLLAAIALAPVSAIAMTTSIPAGAATVGTTFDFSGGFGSATSFDFSKPDLGLTVSSNIGEVSKRILGLGVISQVSRLNNDASFEIEKGEELILDFGKEISLETATFTFVDRRDDASLEIDGSQFIQGNIRANGSGLFSPTVSFKNLFGNGLSGSSFAFGAVDRNDGYLLKKVTVRHLADGTEIPEPLTILGTLAAVGAGAAIKRKHSQAKEA